MEDFVNKRAEPRVAIDALVKVGEGDREYVFRTRDLSKSGLFLYTKLSHTYPLSVGSTIELEPQTTVTVETASSNANGSTVLRQPTSGGLKRSRISGRR